MRVVSVAFAALLPDPPEPHGGGDAAQARWLPYGSVGPLAFDHVRILADAHERVGAKLEYTCLATSFCPPEFTLGELQRIYETVWGAVLDRPNFRRKVLATPGFVAPVPGAARLTGGRGKPAALYRAGGATALQPPLLRPLRKDGPHDHHPDAREARRHRIPARPRPRRRAGLPDRVQRRPLDPGQVRPLAGDEAAAARDRHGRHADDAGAGAGTAYGDGPRPAHTAADGTAGARGVRGLVPVARQQPRARPHLPRGLQPPEDRGPTGRRPARSAPRGAGPTCEWRRSGSYGG